MTCNHLVVISDAWQPQVNGIVRTLVHLRDEMDKRGYRVTIVSPLEYRSIPCPTYPEIRLALTRPKSLRRRLEALQPAFIHIATEGPLGLMARHACRRHAWPFTTSFHTRFPEYVRQRFPVPEALIYVLLQWFHSASTACLVPTASICRDLSRRGFRNLTVWTRGVDRSLFFPRPSVDLRLPGPVFAYVGRVSPEKNLEAFLDLDLPGSKLVVGDGPSLSSLRKRYPQAVFAGRKTGEDLARYFAGSDVLVFPSRTDTFGLVLLEAIACGTPVAAFPVPGPVDVIGATGAGVLSDDLHEACRAALQIGRVDPDRALAGFSWEDCADIFQKALLSPRVHRDPRAEAASRQQF